MRRTLLHLSIALVAFGISSLVVFEIYSYRFLVSEERQTTENIAEIKKENKGFESNCEEQQLIPFWEKLDKEAFLNFAKMNLGEFGGESSNYQFESQQISKFNCSYFREFQTIDVNGDGEKEILLRGSLASNRGDRQIFLFQLKQEKYEPILFDISGKELELTNKKHNGYSKIILRTEWFTGGGRKISHYRYNGKTYKPIKCFTEYVWVSDVNGHWSKYKKPLIESAPCLSD